MKHLILFTTVLLLMWPASAQEIVPETTDLDTVSVQQSAPTILNQAVAGVWRYDKPSVQAQGSSVVGKLGKPIAKSKLKKKLDKAFKKLKINKRWQSLELTPDGQWTMNIAGLNMGGKYDYDRANERLTLRWHGLPLRSQVQRDGKHLHLLFDTDRLLTILKWISGFSSNDVLKSIAFLSENFHDVKVGFDLKQQ